MPFSTIQELHTNTKDSVNINFNWK